MIYAMASSGLLGVLAWLHHMYTPGLDADTRAFLTSVTMVIAILTGIKKLAWLIYPFSKDNVLTIDNYFNLIINILHCHYNYYNDINKNKYYISNIIKDLVIYALYLESNVG